MFPKTIQELAALPLAELEQRASELAVKCTEMLERPQFIGRDLNSDGNRKRGNYSRARPVQRARALSFFD